MTMHEVQEAANVIYSAVSDEANIIFGAIIDEHVHGEVRITVIATGFDMSNQPIVKRRPMSFNAAIPAPRVEQRSLPELKKIASEILDIPEFLKARQGR